METKHSIEYFTKIATSLIALPAFILNCILLICFETYLLKRLPFTLVDDFDRQDSRSISGAG